MESKPVAWANTLPLPLRGGPKSETQRLLREGRLNEPNEAVIIIANGRGLPVDMAADKLKCAHSKECGGRIEMCKGGEVMKHYCKGGKVELNMGGEVREGYMGGGNVHSQKFDRCVEKLKSEGSPAPAPICMKSIGYTGSVNAGHRRKPGYQEGGTTEPETKFDNLFGGGTGQSDPNVIQSDKVVNTKKFDDHEGEFYASAPLTQILGGGKAVENILLNEARKIIRSKISPDKNAMPIMNKGDQNIAKSPGQLPRPGFQTGGITLPDEPEQLQREDAGGISFEPVAGTGGGGLPPQLQQAPNQMESMDYTKPRLTQDNEGTIDLSKAPGSQLVADAAGIQVPAPAQAQPAISTPAAAPAPAPVSFSIPKAESDKAALDAARAAGFESLADYQEAQTTGATPQQFYAARTVTPQANAAINLMKGRRTLTAQELNFIKTANPAQLADFLLNEGAISQDQAAKTKTAYYTANPTAPGAEAYQAGAAGAVPKTRWDAQVEAGLRMLQDYAAGKNPVMDGIINETMQQFGSDTAAGMEALKMDLARQGITGPAANAILASYDRNSRIEENKLRGDFAQKVMDEARLASKELLTTSMAQQSAERNMMIEAEGRQYSRNQAEEQRQRTADEKAFQVALDAGDVKTAASLYKKLYGIDLDTTTLTTKQQSSDVAAGTRDLLAAFKLDANMDYDSQQGQLYMKPALTKIWNSMHPGQPMDEAWAKNFATDFRTKNSDVYRLMNRYTEDEARRIFFADDAKLMADWTNPYTGEKGWLGWKSFMVQLNSPGVAAITWTTDAAGNRRPDVDITKVLKFLPKITARGPITGNMEAGKTVTLLGDDYSVIGSNADGTFTAIGADNKTYTMKNNTDGSWSAIEKPGSSPTGEGFAAFATDDSGNKISVTDGNDSNRPLTWNGSPLTVSYNGKSEYVYKVNGAYQLKDGTEVKLDATTGTPTVIQKVKLGQNFIKPDGSAINDPATNTPIKVTAITGSGMAYGVAADGKVYSLAKGSNIPIEVKPEKIDDALTAITDPTQKANLITAIASSNKSSDAYLYQYVNSTTNPNIDVVAAFYDAGTPGADAIVVSLFANGKMDMNNVNHYNLIDKVARGRGGYKSGNLTFNTAGSNMAAGNFLSWSGARVYVNSIDANGRTDAGGSDWNYPTVITAIDDVYYNGQLAHKAGETFSIWWPGK